MNRKDSILYFATSFISGLCVMGIETSASRLLSPYFGSTNLIWATIITLIMLSLCLGNYIGGKLADKNNSAEKLYIYILFVALWSFVMPFFAKYVIMFSVIIGGLLPVGNAIQIASVISCTILFMFPLTLLGFISPYLAKLCVNDLFMTGRIIGKISVYNTIGSILGTILPTFILIPLIGVKFSFFVFAFLLLFISIVYFIINKKKRRSLLTATAIFVSAFMMFITNKNMALDSAIYETESMYNYIAVTEEKNMLALKTNIFFGSQSMKNLNDNELTGLYYDYFAALPLFITDIYNKEDEKLNVLIIGYCTGTASDILKKNYNVSISGVEIDKKIIDVAEKYFWKGASEDKIFIDDGRNYIENCTDKYDIIIVDVYQNISIPINFTSKEFFASCKNSLKEDGIIAMNIGLGNSTNSNLVQYLGQTLKISMKNVYAYKTPIDNNVLVMGISNKDALDKFEKNIGTINKNSMYSDMHTDIKENIKCIEGDTKILTDDLNNIELLQQEEFDKIIKEQLHINFESE